MMKTCTGLNWDGEPAQLDHQLGFRIDAIEAELLAQARALRPQGNHHTWGEGLHQGMQSWVGLDPQTLLTPYAELKQMCQLVNPHQESLVLDLGAGYGRLGIVLADLYPQVNFLGLELVPERVREGHRIFQQLGLSQAQLHQQDLTSPSFVLPPADVYFLYDYGKVSHIEQTLNQLSQLAQQRKFKVIGRGKGTRSLIENYHPWLCALNPVEHRDAYSIYTWA